MNRRIIQLCSAVLLAVLSVFMIKTAMGTEQPVPARAAAMEAPETEQQATAQDGTEAEQQTTVPDGADIGPQATEPEEAGTDAAAGMQPMLLEEIMGNAGMQEYAMLSAGTLRQEQADTFSLEDTTELVVEAIVEEEVKQEQSEYSDFAIADVSNYVNVREQPTTESAVVGKIYDGAVAQILETAGENGDWYRIISGNVEGYIKAEFFIAGEAAAEVIDNYVTRYAQVLPARLNVRENPDVTSKRVGYIDEGEKVKVLENLGDWIQVQYTDTKTGYVSAEYVTLTEEFVYAKTLEEEAAELAAKKALEARESVSEAVAGENITITSFPATDYASVSELRSGIVEFAKQYLGNKYVHGGSSLEKGTDCSGFTSLIYAQFGYSISRTPSGQLANDGKSISYDSIQPGDIICYGSSGKCTHVALYIGDGQIIHSANSRKGVIINNADYDTILGIKSVID